MSRALCCFVRDGGGARVARCAPWGGAATGFGGGTNGCTAAHAPLAGAAGAAAPSPKFQFATADMASSRLAAMMLCGSRSDRVAACANRVAGGELVTSANHRRVPDPGLVRS
jgi:hypothetical protein